MHSLIPIVFALYYYTLFEISNLRTILKIIFGISFLEFVIVLFSPTHFYTSLILAIQTILYAEFIYFFILTFYQISSKKKGAKLLLLCLVVILIGGLNDILYLNLIINTTQISTGFGKEKNKTKVPCLPFPSLTKKMPLQKDKA